MATKKHNCTMCGKPIRGKIKIITYKKVIGNKSIQIVEMYDEKCFLIKNKERSLNGHTNQKRRYKTRDKKKARV